MSMSNQDLHSPQGRLDPPGSRRGKGQARPGTLLRCLALALFTFLCAAQPGPTKTLIVGIDRDDRPFEYLDAHGNPAGYDVDLVRAIAKLEGLEVTFHADSWENIRSQFAARQLDLLPGMLYSEERKAEVAFSARHLVVHYSMFVRNGSPKLMGLGDLPGRRILVQQKSEMQEYLGAQGLGPFLHPVVSEPEALRQLAAGRGNVAIVTKLQGMVLARQEGLAVSPVAGPIMTRQLCLAVQKDQSELLARLDTALAILNQTGRYAEIYDQWFGSDTRETQVGRVITRWAVGAGVLGILTIGLVLVWTRSMRRRVDRATAQLQRANQEIKTREAFLDTIIENLPVAIFGKDVKQGLIFTLWNHRSEEVFGLSKAEVLGKSDYDFFPKEQSDWFREKDLEVIREGKAIDIPLEQVTSKTLGVISLFTRKVPLFDEQGEPTLLLGIAEDRTAQLSMEEALRQAQKLESLGVLAGGIAHDFNNLLTAILGNVGLVRTQVEDGEPVEPYLDKIEKTALRAADLTRQMLAYSGRGVFVKVPLALDDAVREMVNLLKVSISKKVHLRFEFEEGLSAIEGDTAQIQQVIMNLVTNASEAIGDQEGEIRLSLRLVELDSAQGSAIHPATPIQSGRYVALSVKDTGAGMSPETLARIFDPFFTTKFSGRGLGMSAMLGILKAHQAGIRIKSELGVGTEFQVFLPETDAPALRVSSKTITHLPRGRVTLLVVDDEPDVLEATSHILEQLDFLVIRARDGQEAVEVYFHQSSPIQAVLMDLTMPRMDGIEAATEILRRDPTARLILTSGFSPSPHLGLNGLGLAGFLQKPFGRDQLLEALRPVLGEGF